MNKLEPEPPWPQSAEPERTTNAADNPTPGAPSDHAGKCNGEIQTSIEPVPCGLPLGHEGPHGLPKYVSSHGLTQDIYTVGEVDKLLDAECKAAVAAALEQANEEFWRVWHKQTVGTPVVIAITHSIEAATNTLSPSPNYIALREAEAEIAEAKWWADHDVEDYDTQSQWDELAAERIAALTEARDKLVKK